MAQSPIKITRRKTLACPGSFDSDFDVFDVFVHLYPHFLFYPVSNRPYCFPSLFAISEIPSSFPYLVYYYAFFFPRFKCLALFFLSFLSSVHSLHVFFILHIFPFIVLLIDPERQSTRTTDISVACIPHLILFTLYFFLPYDIRAV